MKPRVKKLFSLLAGWTFIVLGVLGLFLPFLQGILFLLVGLIILSKHYKFAQQWLDKLKSRYPAAFDMAYQFRLRLMNRWNKKNTGKNKVSDSHDETSLAKRSD